MKSHKVKVGIFLVGGALLFTAGLFLIGNRNQVFSHHFDAYTEFSSIDTIENGAKIRVSGMDAGEVSSIDVPRDPGAKFRLKLHISQKFEPIVRANSVATIETEGMVGNKFINVQKGTNASPVCAGCTLPSQEPVEIGQLISEAKNIMKTTEGTIADLRDHAGGVMENVKKASGHVDQMIVAMRGDVEKIASNGAKISSDVNGIVSNVRQGHGVAGKLLTDDTMANDVKSAIGHTNKAVADIEQASGKANAIVSEFQQKNIPEDLHQAVAKVRDLSQDLDGEVKHFTSGGPGENGPASQIRETIDDAQRASANLASDTEAIKHNFFLRGFFKRRGFYNLNHMNPVEYAGSEFVKHAAKRIWLAAADLFDSNQKLSKEGEAALDNAMAEMATYLPNNPIMIEGYSDNGTAAQRFLTAGQRADEVRKYLESHFHLQADLLGTIPLGDKPPRGVGKESWSGVCLVLVVSRN